MHPTFPPHCFFSSLLRPEGGTIIYRWFARGTLYSSHKRYDRWPIRHSLNFSFSYLQHASFWPQRRGRKKGPSLPRVVSFAGTSAFATVHVRTRVARYEDDSISRDKKSKISQSTLSFLPKTIEDAVTSFGVEHDGSNKATKYFSSKGYNN